MTTNIPKPKRYGKQMPTPIDDGSRICFSIQLPDLLEYRAALMGQLNDLGYWFSWAHTQSDYADPPQKNVDVAELWVQLVADASFEVCMSICEQIIDCINNDTDVQKALADFINQRIPAAPELPANTPLPPATTAADMFAQTNPTCDPDILWSQCIGLVNTAAELAQDFLETWEVYSNQGEIISDVINSIPAVAEGVQASGLAGMIEYANDLADAIIENFVADNTLEYRQQLACEIFCAAKDTCEVSIDLVAGIMNTRISNTLNLTNLVELLASLMDHDIEGVNTADLYLAFFFNSIAIANWVLPTTWGIQTFLNVIRLFDEPSNDWEVLCVDCPPDPEACEGAQASQDFRLNDGGFVPSHPEFDYGQWTNGIGWHTKPPANTFTISIERSFTQPVNKVRVYTNQPISGNLYIRTTRANGWATLTPGATSDGTEGLLYWYEFTLADITTGICYQVLAGSIPNDFAIVRACEWWEE